VGDLKDNIDEAMALLDDDMRTEIENLRTDDNEAQ
jgi:hypothetical protein